MNPVRTDPRHAVASRLIPAVAGLLILSSPTRAAEIHPLIAPLLDPGSPSAVLPLPLRPVESGGTLCPQEESIGVWVRTRDGGRSLEAAGLLLLLERPMRLRAARWTREQLRAAACDPNVESLSPAVRCSPLLDASLVETKATLAHEGSGTPPTYIGLTGKGTIVGIIDSGIDLLHDDFRDSTGRTRLVALWDQTVASSDPPRGFQSGKEWTASQINAGLARVADRDGHGTHVAGIAAGNGSATAHGQPAYTYVGMAPEAAIVAVKSDFLATSIVDGILYVFQKADSLGMPAVVNLSLGTQQGPHDGTDDFARAVSELAGPGHLIVAAAGNDWGSGHHARRVITAPDSATITFNVDLYRANDGALNDEIDLDGWYDGGSSLAFRLITPDGTIVGPVSKGSSANVDTRDGRVEISNETTGVINKDENVTFRIYDGQAGFPPAPGIWRIQIFSAITSPSPTGSSQIDIWNFYESEPIGTTFLQGVDETDLVRSPASADSVIAVGAYVTKGHWVALDGVTYGYDPPPTIRAIASYSSVGPRRDGVLKPDIAAPGQGIASALSGDAIIDPYLILRDGVHAIFHGTSMACAHVTGLLSLMQESYGTLTVRSATKRLSSSARRDMNTGSLPNPTWGHGKIDALKATGHILPVTLLEATAEQEGDRVHVRFVLSEDAGSDPLPVWRQDPDATERTLLGWSSSGRERTYVDSTLTADGTYLYWSQIIEFDEARWIGPARIDYVRSRGLSLQTYPNPFLDRLRIRWATSSGRASLSIFDPSGRRIRSIALADHATVGSLEWDGTDARGAHVPAGVYILRFQTGGDRCLEQKILRVR